MNDTTTYVFCALLFFSGLIGQLSSHHELRVGGVYCMIASILTALIVFGITVVENRRRELDDHRYYQDRTQEQRLNDLEVWREEAEPETQFLKDRITNLESGLEREPSDGGVFEFFLITAAGLLFWYLLEWLWPEKGGKDVVRIR